MRVSDSDDLDMVPDLTIHLNADPDPTFHFYKDLDPYLGLFSIPDPDPNPEVYQALDHCSFVYV